MKKTIQEKRKELKDRSKAVKELVDAGEYETINQAIVDQFYRNENHEEFDTFNGWKGRGKMVKKGETAFVIWGKPVKKADDEKPEAQEPEKEGEEAERDFWPVSHIFSNQQVNERQAPYLKAA